MCALNHNTATDVIGPDASVTLQSRIEPTPRDLALPPRCK